MFWVVPNNPIAAVTPANKALLRRFLNNKSKVTSTGTLEDRDRHYYPKMNISVDLPRRFKSAVFKLKYQHNHFTWPQHHEVLCIKCKPLQPQHVFGFSFYHGCFILFVSLCHQIHSYLHVPLPQTPSETVCDFNCIWCEDEGLCGRMFPVMS